MYGFDVTYFKVHKAIGLRFIKRACTHTSIVVSLII